MNRYILDDKGDIKMAYKITVIVPIYNVRNFIARCANSLMKQTLDEVEYVFVNDATLDDSMLILNDVLDLYPTRKNSVIIIDHPKNLGLPAARNSGIAVAQGDYIFHCDSDDFVEIDMLEKMWNTAISIDADIVWSDWYLSYGSKERYMCQPDYKNANEALKGILSGKMKYNVWNKLVKRTLYTDNHILFPAGHGMGEDMTMILLFAYAQKVAYVPQAFYHYVKTNVNAMTFNWSDKHLKDLSFNVDRTIHLIFSKYGLQLNPYIQYFKLNVKLPFLITDDFKMYQVWSKWYTESNIFIWKNKDICLRTKILQWMAYKRQYWFVWLYYKIIQDFIYRILFRYK